MQFDPDNHVVRLCAKGMELEAEHDSDKAKELFLQAWNDAKDNFEKFTAAHYVARHQQSIEDKFHWDITALTFALKIEDKSMEENYPSLYLNIAKCYEDLDDIENAQINYQKAFSHATSLPDNGYGRMIKSGIQKGLEDLSINNQRFN